MKNNRKRGITVTSIVIYVVLFFMFTTATVTISSRINKNLFNDRGLSINVTAINKLEYNLLKSSDESTSADVSIDGNITTIEFSNTDKYVFNLDKQTVYKNGGKLLEFMTEFDIRMKNKDKSLEMDIALNKYTNKVKRTITINNTFDANYVDEGMVVRFDGINNAGLGSHSDEATVWKDLTGNTDGTSLNETFVSTGLSNVWLDDGLLFTKESENYTLANGTNESYASMTVEVTLEFLDTLGTSGSDYVYFLSFPNGASYTLLLGTRNNVVLMYGSGNSTVLTPSSLNIKPNVKYTFTFVQDNMATRSLYINGALVATQQITGLSEINLLQIKQTSSTLASYISNSVRIYNRALTLDEIQKNYTFDKIRFGE